MRIAQVVPRGEQPWSGVMTVIVHLAVALARRDHQIRRLAAARLVSGRLYRATTSSRDRRCHPDPAPSCATARAGRRWVREGASDRSEVQGVERLEQIIARLGVGDRIQLVGERHGNQLRQSVGAADVSALLSRWEGMPMSLLEALALGRPAVVIPAVEGLIGIDAAGAGWVADEDRPRSVLRHLQSEGRDELARRGRAALLLSRRYDWDSVALRHEVAYERALQRRHLVTT